MVVSEVSVVLLTRSIAFLLCCCCHCRCYDGSFRRCLCFLIVVAWHMHQACPPLIVPFEGLLPSCRKEEEALHEGQAGHHGQQGEAAVSWFPHGCAIDGRASVLVWLSPVDCAVWGVWVLTEEAGRRGFVV